MGPREKTNVAVATADEASHIILTVSPTSHPIILGRPSVAPFPVCQPIHAIDYVAYHTRRVLLYTWCPCLFRQASHPSPLFLLLCVFLVPLLISCPQSDSYTIPSRRAASARQGDTVTYELAESAEEIEIEVSDENGNVVETIGGRRFRF